MNKKTLPLYIAIAIVVLVGVWLVVRANSTSPESGESNNNANTNSNAAVPTLTPSTNTPTMPSTQETTEIKDKFVTLSVKGYGDIKFELYEEDAPKAVENFIRLAQSGYYEGISFHRIIPGFVIQAGDPTGTGSGGESAFGKDFADELNPNAPSYKTGYVKGVLAMANRGPNTNSSQFFVTLGDMNQQLAKSYTIFGKVVSGMDVVDKIGSRGTPGGTPQDKIVIEKATVTDK